MERFVLLIVRIILFVIFSAVGFCQTDTEFWFVAPEVSQNGTQDLDRPIYLRMSSFDHPSIVTVSQPANPSFKPITVSIAANSSQTVDLTPFIDMLENKPPDRVLNYGIYIKATKPIQAYYEVASLETNFNPELFALKGKNALGTHFIIPGQIEFRTDGNYFPDPYYAFDIVAIKDSTSVTIIPKKDIIGHREGIPFTISLNMGQTYSAAGIGYVANNHPFGSEVSSDKPIAITLKDDMLNGKKGCADLTGDQLVPVNLVGTEYNAVMGFLGETEYIFITATENNTIIKIWDPNYNSFTLNKSETMSHTINSNACHIESDKPVYVYQVSGIGCELGSALLPHTKCTGSRQVAFTRTTAQLLSMMIFTTSDAISGFTVNGNPNIIKSSDFSAVPGTNNQWQYSRFSFDTATIHVDQTCIITNSINFFHLGVLEGAVRTGCSYGFFSDYNSLNLGQDITICPDDSVELDAGYGKEPYRWSDGSTVRSIVVHDTGTYWVIARLGNCEVRDTIHVSFATPNILSLGKDRTLCEGDSIFISAGGGFRSYRWNTGDTTVFIIVKSNGVYSVKTVSLEGCIQSDTVYVTAFDTNIRITSSGNPCAGDTVRLFTESGFSFYWWYCPSWKVLNWVNYLDVTKSGKYWVEGHTITGCIAHSDTIEITFTDNNLELSSNPPLNNNQLEFGDVYMLGIDCLSITLTNKSTEPYALNDVYLKYNTVFSTPQSQFPMQFAPGESKELIICFAPVSKGEQRDTVLISDSCMSVTFALMGNGIGITRTGLSGCGVPVILVTEEIDLHSLGVSLPNPNNENNYLQIKSNYTSGKIEIYTILGIKVIETEYKDRIDVSGLSAGVYFLRICDKVFRFAKI